VRSIENVLSSRAEAAEPPQSRDLYFRSYDVQIPLDYARGKLSTRASGAWSG